MMDKAVERPENIGDIYRFWGYSGVEGWRHGATYRATDPLDKGRWCWWIEMDDCDYYTFPEQGKMRSEDIEFFDKCELVRRNPLPGKELP